ncbi:MAG: sulfotransferase [Novosphingobium sp.]|nr:sulfotransferase [Novosphingobium sp.]
MRISRQYVLDEAVRRAGHDDFGEPAFLDGLNALIASIAEDGRLAEDRRAGVTEKLIGPLVQRLRLYADRRRHREIPAQAITAPLVVIGLPRSGTTFLHALLSRDPGTRSPLSWQLSNLSPPPRRESLDTDPRIAAVAAALAQLPDDFKRMHMVGAKLPEECNAITTMGFVSPNFDAGLDVASYLRWFMEADARPAYQTHRHTLQHLQAFTGGGRWVLKAPPHMYHMDALFATYPDARIVFPHRDPADTIPSLASLVASIRRWTYADVDQAAIGRWQMETWAVALERALAFRADSPYADRFVDVSYDALVARPMETVEAIYSRFGMMLTPDAERAIRAFLADKPKDKHGAHRYTLAEAGLTREAVRERFGAYLAAHLPALV